MEKPAFLITIDTEGDNQWEKNTITTENAKFLSRFQQLCEKFGFKPTWLTNYEMACDPAYIEFAADVIKRNTGEIGMHLHAWHSPPEYALTANDIQYKPYLIEYPESVIRNKISTMTHLLEDTFQIKMRSHRAGRWAFNAFYAALLREHGYLVDCSVTPRVSWKRALGNPQGNGGTDYSQFPDVAYWLDPEDISRPGNSTLLEVPMSIHYRHPRWKRQAKQCWDALSGKQRNPSVDWLRPKGGNLDAMKKVVQQSLAGGGDYVEFMLHSSEFMPGGSPTFRDDSEIERLYDDLEQLFLWLSDITVGMSLSEYYSHFKK